MFLHTSRLTVPDLSLEVLHTRLHSADLLADVPPRGGRCGSAFRPSGRRRAGPDRTEGEGLRPGGPAIGMMSVKGEPDAQGDIGISSGLNPKVWT